MVPLGGPMGGPGLGGPGMGSPSLGGGSMGGGLGMPGIPGMSALNPGPGPGDGGAGGGGMDAQMHMRMRDLQHKKEYVAKQQRWLLFLRHCAKCQAAEGQCTYGQSCTVAKQLWRHILTCADPNCEYPRCSYALPSVAVAQHHLSHCV